MQIRLLLLVGLFLAGFFRSAFADEMQILEKGMGFYYQKNWDQAISSFKTVLQENPKNTMAVSFLLVSHLQKGTLDKAIDEIEDKLIDNPRDPVMQSYLGFALYTRSIHKGRQVREDAMREFRGAAIQEALGLTHTGLGLLYQDRGQLSRARKEFQRALDLDNKDLLAMEYLGQLYLYEEKKPEDANKLFSRITQLAPGYPDAYFYMARVSEEAGRINDAINYYKHTIELDPNGVGRGYTAPAYLGELYLKQKEYSLAANAFRQALKHNPNSAVIKQKLERAEKGPSGDTTTVEKKTEK